MPEKVGKLIPLSQIVARVYQELRENIQLYKLCLLLVPEGFSTLNYLQIKKKNFFKISGSQFLENESKCTD